MQSVLFIEKVFLHPVKKSPGGVELFNLSLLRDLAAMGCAVTVPAHRDWEPRMSQHAGNGRLEFIRLPGHFSDSAGGLAVLWKLRAHRFDLALLGNVGDRLIPLLWMLRRLRLAPRLALIAHREPGARFIHALRAMPTRVTAVNRQIAAHFTRGGIPAVKVEYGIIQAELFHPAAAAAPQSMVNFCVVGHLERPWKGHATAVAAFGRLPPGIKENCRLHLAGFAQPPAFPDAGIIAYPWQPYTRVGEFLRRMDVMIVPSRDDRVMRETFSQAAVQGMLTGLPLIVSNLPVLAEKLDQGGGLIFQDLNDLADAMGRLAEDAPLRRRLGAQGRATALARYVWNTQKFMDGLSVTP